MLPAALSMLSAALAAGGAVSTSTVATSPAERVDCAASFEKLRYEDSPACATLALIRTRDWFLAVGGEVRQRVTFARNFEFGAAQVDGDWSNTQRYLLYVDARRAELLQLYVQLGSQVAVDLEGPPNPIERNDFDLRQAFLRGKLGAVRPWVGRRVLSYGSERLVSRREGPNLRRVFDGLGVELDPGPFRIDLVLARPVDVNPVGVFNDFQWLDSWLWGAYTTVPLSWSGLEVYYLGFRDEDATYVAGTAPETRHSFGSRWSGNEAGWDWNVEGIVQVGEFGDGSIWAWTLASIAGYTFRHLPWSPRLAVSANVASGDDDPDDDRLGAFNALYPRGNYFSEAAVLGPRNFYNAHGYLALSPLPGLLASVDVNAYWRASTSDGVYGPPGNVIRGPGMSNERFVALSVSSALGWRLNRFFDATAIYTHIAPGAFIRATGPSPVTHFVELTLRLRL